MGRSDLFHIEIHSFLRLQPFAVGQAGHDQVFLQLLRNLRTLYIERLFPAAPDQEITIAAHRCVMLPDNPVVTVTLPHPIRDQYARVRPACRGVKNIHVSVHGTARRALGKAAVFVLRVRHVSDILSAKGSIVEQIGRRIVKDLRVAGPAHALPRRTVGGNVRAVVLR